MISRTSSAISARGVLRALRSVPVALLILLIQVYRNTFSLVFPPSCRYTPTCSQYAMDALRKYGVVSGLVRAGRRVLRCHPYSRHGSYDPA